MTRTETRLHVASNSHHFKTILIKELTEIVRDPRSLILLMISSALVSPLCMQIAVIACNQVQAAQLARPVISIMGDAAPLFGYFHKNEAFDVRRAGAASPQRELDLTGADVVLSLPENFSKALRTDNQAPVIGMYVNSRRSSSPLAISRIMKALNEFEEECLADRLARHQISDMWKPLVEPQYVYQKERESAPRLLIAGALPLFLLVVVGAAVFSTTIHLFAGERDNDTLSTLFLTCAPPRTVLYAKYAAISLSGMIAALIALASQAITFSFFPFAKSLLVSPLNHVLAPLLLISVPLVALTAAAAVFTALIATNLQQAQTYSAIMFMCMLGLCGLALLGSLPLDSLVQLIPIASLSVASREIMRNHFQWPWIVLAMAVSTFYAYILFRAAASRFEQLDLIICAEDSRDRRYAQGNFTIELVVFVAVLFLLMLYVGHLLERLDEVYGTAIIQLTMVLGPSLFLIKCLRQPLKETLSLRLPQIQVMAAGALLAPLTVVLSSLLVQPQNQLIPMPRFFQEIMKDIVLPQGRPIWAIYLCMAVLPAICEEIAFRGALLGLLRKALPVVPRVLLVSAIFGMFHMSVFRFLPVAFLGLVAAVLTLVTGSLYPAIVLHAAHDSLALYGSSHASNMADPLVISSALFFALMATALLALSDRPKKRE